MARPTLPTHAIDGKIMFLRGRRVILDADLADIYGVETRVLNQAVRRNKHKFPNDFMLQLTRAETKELQLSRSQTVTLKRGQNIKYLPYVFTEHPCVPACL